MKEFTHVIADPLGLHARPAGMLVKAAAGYASSVTVTAPTGKADAKRLMAVMRLAAKQGMELTVTCEGADEEAAAEKGVTGLFADLVRFAGDKGLIGLNLPRYHHRIGEDLLSGSEHGNVVPHHFFLRDLQHDAVPDHGGTCFRENGELIQRFFAAQLLNDADDGVDDDDDDVEVDEDDETEEIYGDDDDDE